MDLAAILLSQYLASLAMLEETILKCSESVWDSPDDRNKFWHSAYHALFFTHLYVEESEETFTPWPAHREGYEDFDLPPGAEPYDKETVLAYLAFCRRHLAERLPQLDLSGREGFGDRTYNTAELQIYSIRHIMQHAGELMERLGNRTGAEIRWVGRVRG